MHAQHGDCCPSEKTGRQQNGSLFTRGHPPTSGVGADWVEWATSRRWRWPDWNSFNYHFTLFGNRCHPCCVMSNKILISFLLQLHLHSRERWSPFAPVWIGGRRATTICHTSNRIKGAASERSEEERERGSVRPFQKIKWCKWAVNDRDQSHRGRMKNGEEGSGNGTATRGELVNENDESRALMHNFEIR